MPHHWFSGAGESSVKICLNSGQPNQQKSEPNPWVSCSNESWWIKNFSVYRLPSNNLPAICGITITSQGSPPAPRTTSCCTFSPYKNIWMSLTHLRLEEGKHGRLLPPFTAQCDVILAQPSPPYLHPIRPPCLVPCSPLELLHFHWVSTSLPSYYVSLLPSIRSLCVCFLTLKDTHSIAFHSLPPNSLFLPQSFSLGFSLCLATT